MWDLVHIQFSILHLMLLFPSVTSLLRVRFCLTQKLTTFFFFLFDGLPLALCLLEYTSLDDFPRETLPFYRIFPTSPLIFTISLNLLFASQEVITICNWASGCLYVHCLSFAQVPKSRYPNVVRQITAISYQGTCP